MGDAKDSVLARSRGRRIVSLPAISAHTVWSISLRAHIGPALMFGLRKPWPGALVDCPLLRLEDQFIRVEDCRGSLAQLMRHALLAQALAAGEGSEGVAALPGR
jgi:hypothetical protein